MMATTTIERADLRALRRKLDARRVNSDGTQSVLVQATDRFLTAAEYQDDVLMRSALTEAKAALTKEATEKVEELVTLSLEEYYSIFEFTNDFEGLLVTPDHQSDEFGRSISAHVSSWLRYLGGFRDGPLEMARRHNLEVPNAAKLDEQIALWEEAKVNLVDCWPWTDSPLPPADREMIARSRAAFQAGERGESIEAVIARLRSE